MEEYITRAEFEAYKKHMEQKTEEMKAIRVDVHNVDVEAIKQELHNVADTLLQTLQEHHDEHKVDIADVKTVLSGHAKYFEEHGRRLSAMATKEDLGQLRSEMATKNDITRLEGLIMQLLQQKPNDRPE